MTKEIDADRFYPEPGEARATIPNGIHLIVSSKLATSALQSTEAGTADEEFRKNVLSFAGKFRAMAMRRKLKQPEDHRRTLVARHGLAAIAAVAAEAAVSYPLDTLKSLKQVCAGSLNPKP